MIAFQQITTAIKDAIEAANLVDKVMKGRLRPMAENEQSAIVVRYDRSSGQAGGTQDGPTDWDTAIAIDLYWRVTDGSDPEDAAGDVLSQVYALLMGLNPSALGISDLVSNPEIVAAPSDPDPNLTCLTLFLTVQHRTYGNNLNPWS